jgi:phage-related protein
VAGQSIIFDFLSRGAAALSRDFRSIGTDSALSSRGVKTLQGVIEKLGAKSDRTAAESKILAGALRQTGDASATAAAKMVVADAAVRRLGDAMQDSQKKTGGLRKALKGLSINPGLAGPILALTPAIATLGGVAAGAAAGLAGAFAAGGIALGTFGAVAKPVLTDAKTAADAVGKAQDTYNATIKAGVPVVQAQATLQAANARAQLAYNTALAGGAKPAQALAAYHAALARNQLAYNTATNAGTFNAKAYAAEQAAIGKAYAGLSPQQIALSKQLGAMADSWDKVKAAQTPVVAGALQPWLQSVTSLTKQMGPVVAATAAVIGSLGSQFNAIVTSKSFTTFRDFIANTGSRAVGAAGNAMLGLIQGFITLLPKFQPLIQQAVTWLGNLGPAIEKWASSKKTADDITAFMAWFKANGPVVGGLLTNIGLALKALAPGLTAGGVAEVQIMSNFFAFIAKLPPDLAKPLTEVAASLLILNKLGVVKVGIQLTGLAQGSLLAGAGAAGGPLALAGAAIGAGFILSVKNAIQAGWQGVLKILPSIFGGIGGILNLSATGWTNAILDHFATPIRAMWANLGHFLASSFDVTRAQVAAIAANLWHQVVGSFDQTRAQVTGIWNTVWNNTVTRAANGVRDVITWFNNLRAGAALAWSQISSQAAAAWNTIWANTVTRAANGVRAVITWFGNLRAGAATAMSLLSSAVAGTWNTIWANTISRVSNGVTSVVNFFRGLPGKITAALGAAGTVLTNWGKGVINGLLSGMTSVINSVWTFIKGIPGKILSFLGIKSPPQWAIDAGVHIMNGIGIGMTQARSALSKATSSIASFVSNLVNAPGSGVSRWIPLVQQALKMEGLDPGLLRNVLIQMQSESGGNPNIWNTTDINAQHGTPSGGLMQVIGPTFAAYHWPGTSNNLLDPLANIAAALNYARHRYGPSLMSGGMGIGSGHGYAYGTASAAPGWAWVGERGPELLRFRGGEQVAPYAGSGGGQDGLIAELRALRAELRQLTGVAAAIPASTGRHVGGAINGSAGAASFRGRYPTGGA